MDEKETRLVKPKYMQVMVLKTHCPECGEQLQGNNSVAMPYMCYCGVWRPCPDNPGFFNIEPGRIKAV